mmetsp:Transcript_41094/g.67443  ORF Transcript_41094/g.67443 Transcript_41094/m.67443 type:complete len:135 (+) Transcript_41094:55-459(+)
MLQFTELSHFIPRNLPIQSFFACFRGDHGKKLAMANTETCEETSRLVVVMITRRAGYAWRRGLTNWDSRWCGIARVVGSQQDLATFPALSSMQKRGVRIGMAAILMNSLNHGKFVIIVAKITRTSLLLTWRLSS